MSTVRKPSFTVFYNQKNITSEITPYLNSITYKDAVEGKCDEVQLEVSNVSGVWLDEWYPVLGDSLTVSIGFENNTFNCGDFEIDEVQWQLSPDIIRIKGIAAGVKNAMRTRRSDQHEGKTLAQIIKKVADRNGFTIVGNIVNQGQLVRETQDMETDLAFLRRMAKTYGHVFSLRGKKITFTSIYELEALASATTITRGDLSPGTTMSDKSYDTYKKVHMSHFNPASKKVIETDFEFPEVTNADGFSYNAIGNSNVKEVLARADNGGQALNKAIAALHSSNSKQQEGTLVMVGNPFVVSGNNVALEECGKLSGKYHVMQSEHFLKPKVGYTMHSLVKRVGYIEIAKTKRKKPKKVKPIHVNVLK